ncbi:MAG: DUF373 family protein [Candidatus Bathyarchaeota archaeon]|nr:DUF373 family protein [Candidatus Bathyarchaeota archaeon]
MAIEDMEQTAQKRILVLCVDRDGDIGAKAEIKTPIVGRQETLDAAVTLALRDPEEPDANAMFEAVRVYDKLKSENKPDEVPQIAAISGSELGGVSSDRKLVAELGELLKSFHATEVVLVTDGYSDEAVLPLVQSRVPVSSVRRIVVKHSESIEETAAIFWRYLKLLFEDPRYSRVALGVPGLLTLILGLLYFFDLLSIFWIVFVFVLSGVLLVKGFGVDRMVTGFYRWAKEYSPPPLRVQITTFSAIAGVLCIGVGIYLGWMSTATFTSSLVVPPSDIGGWIGLLPQMTGYFIKGVVDLGVVGVCVILTGRAIRMYFERDVRLLRNAALIVSVGWSRQILDSTADVLTKPAMGYDKLVLYIVISILIGVASVLVIYVVHRSFGGFFKESIERVEDLGEG